VLKKPVGQRVAVAGWQWWHSIEGISAVILVLVTRCGCQYWRGGSWICKGLKILIFFFCDAIDSNVYVGSRLTGGSGGVAMVALDSWDQRGHFDASYNM
jgi:hypothetical protein